MASCFWGHSCYPRSLVASWTVEGSTDCLCSSDCEFLIIQDSLADQQEHIHTVSRLPPPPPPPPPPPHPAPEKRKSVSLPYVPVLQTEYLSSEQHRPARELISRLNLKTIQCRRTTRTVLLRSHCMSGWLGRVGSNWKQGVHVPCCDGTNG